MQSQNNLKVIAETPTMLLCDIGDDVALIEFLTQAGRLDDDSLSAMDKALDRVEKEYIGLVVSNKGDDFCTGLDAGFILRQARSGNWVALGKAVKRSQSIYMRLRFFPKPVVIAPSGKTLAGGCAMTMHGSRVVAPIETCFGFDEFRYGLLPSGGGIKELMRRILNPAMHVHGADNLPYQQRIFELAGHAKISADAGEALQLGFLGSADRITTDRTHLLSEAHREVLHMSAAGFHPTSPELIYAGGQDARAVMRINAWMLKEGQYISSYDFLIADKLAAILAGGELSRPAWVSEQYILDLESEAFLSLCGEENTQGRLDHLLQTGRPLHN